MNDKWKEVLTIMESRFGKKPDMNAILFVIGMRELGELRQKFSKEEKVKLMHIAVCRLFSISGYYKLQGTDQKGWPHWENTKELPFIDPFEQESLLRQHIISYFEEEEIFE